MENLEFNTVGKWAHTLRPVLNQQRFLLPEADFEQHAIKLQALYTDYCNEHVRLSKVLAYLRKNKQNPERKLHEPLEEKLAYADLVLCLDATHVGLLREAIPSLQAAQPLSRRECELFVSAIMNSHRALPKLSQPVP